MVAIVGAEQRAGKIDVLLGLIPILKEIIGRGAAPRQIRACCQAAIFRMVGQGDGFFGILSRQVGVMRHVGIFSGLLFDARILRGSFEHTSTGHEDVIVFLLRQLVGFQSFLRRTIEVSAIEMELAGIHQYGAGAAMMLMMGIYLSRVMELLKSFAAQLVV